jgi:uncharacterized damage-inducible protein DinB
VQDLYINDFDGLANCSPRSPGIYTFSMSFRKAVFYNDVRHSMRANQQLLDGCAGISAGELERDFRISHNSVLGTLNHIYDGERVWLLCLRTTADLGTWRLPQDPSSQLALDGLKQKWPEISNGFCRWLEELAENSLGVELLLQLPGGIERRFPRWKILRHVLEHSALHHGQVVGMIRMLGHPPPATSPMDYYLAGEANTSA